MDYRKVFEEALQEAQKIPGYKIKKMKKPTGEPFPPYEDHLRPLEQRNAEKFWIKT